MRSVRLCGPKNVLFVPKDTCRPARIDLAIPTKEHRKEGAIVKTDGHNHMR